MSGDEVARETAAPPELPDHQGSAYSARIEAAFLGALAGERAAQAPAAAGDLLEVADSIATIGGFDADDLRRRGLAGSSQAGPAGLLLRAIPFGLLAPLDRPRVRRDAYRVAALAGADEGTAVAAIAAALLIADLTRFDLATSVMRVYQSLLEDAPFALLERLRIGGDLPAGEGDDDPGAALHLAIAALLGADQIEAAIQSAAGTGRRAAISLAGALAGAHLGAAGLDVAWRAEVPHAHRAVALAASVAARIGAVEASVVPPSLAGDARQA
ncbi:MAG: hypothetical protein ABSB36_04310 [Candidatus Dormibacteria bacterium]|jgi:hypothetical protein